MSCRRKVSGSIKMPKEGKAGFCNKMAENTKGIIKKGVYVLLHILPRNNNLLEPVVLQNFKSYTQL